MLLSNSASRGRREQGCGDWDAVPVSGRKERCLVNWAPHHYFVAPDRDHY